MEGEDGWCCNSTGGEGKGGAKEKEEQGLGREDGSAEEEREERRRGKTECSVAT